MKDNIGKQAKLPCWQARLRESVSPVLLEDLGLAHFAAQAAVGWQLPMPGAVAQHGPERLGLSWYVDPRSTDSG